MFSKFEKLLWFCSVAVITASYLIFDRGNALNLISSVIGISSLLFNAKGHYFAHILMILFSIFYGIISYSFGYYGEMVTYLGMTMPMAAIALVSWLKNPSNKKKTEVKTNRISKKESVFMVILTTSVTVAFYFILKALDTVNLLASTFSVFTSFGADYMCFRRSPSYALWYASNDVVLIVLWTLAARENISYLSVVFCFVAFLVNDIYGYISWTKMEKRQRGNNELA